MISSYLSYCFVSSWPQGFFFLSPESLGSPPRPGVPSATSLEEPVHLGAMSLTVEAAHDGHQIGPKLLHGDFGMASIKTCSISYVTCGLLFLAVCTFHVLSSHPGIGPILSSFFSAIPTSLFRRDGRSSLEERAQPRSGPAILASLPLSQPPWRNLACFGRPCATGVTVHDLLSILRFSQCKLFEKEVSRSLRMLG